MNVIRSKKIKYFNYLKSYRSDKYVNVVYESSEKASMSFLILKLSYS